MQNSRSEQKDLSTFTSTSSSKAGTVPSIPGAYCDLDNVKSGAKRKLKINGVRPDPCGYDSNSVRPDPCGYDSDTEQEDTIHGRKRKKIKNRNYKVHQSHADRLSNGHKRKSHTERSNHQRRKRCKSLSSTECDKTSSCTNESSSSSDSSSDLSSASSSDSQLQSSSDCSTNADRSTSSDCSTSSDGSSSDCGMLTEERSNVARIIRKYLKPVRRIIPCPDSCVCVAGPCRPPTPIGRRGKVVEPLYKKLLQRRLLSISNAVPHVCCSRQCYVKWARKRISLYRMVRDYDKSDLHVDNFSWPGQWKPGPESDDESSSVW